ncbi:MAG TPA: helix-turn-helix transcriptional regulator [Pyrinomonadaceae bacterium]|nr:helix-turn-helix transcriptional regulator [Pyrinomonadaceae bacterium]
MSIANEQKLGSFLKKCREDLDLTLRDVEEKTDISNPYLSQLEGNKIKKPSPNVLNKLSELYKTSYSKLMKLAGYPAPEIKETGDLYARIGETSKEEEDALVEYLEFLRAKRSRSNQ